MTFFEFYDIPVSFLPDERLVKRRFYALSKKYHPDFYTLESEEKQAEILELSTFNNEAYKCLSDFDRRMKYILEVEGVLEEEGKAQIPQDFLIEMMEVNEQLMELEFDFDKTAYEAVLKGVEQRESELYQNIAPALQTYSATASDKEVLSLVKDYYYKKRYLLRIQENLNKFASL